MIPLDLNNKDYQEFLAYQRGGGDASPEATPPPDPTQIAIEAARQKVLNASLPVAERFDALLILLSIKNASAASPATPDVTGRL
jgi:hypothetical protein